MANVLDADRFVKPVKRVLTCRTDDPVQSAAETMRTHKVGCLVVVNADGVVAGILTERDIISRVAATGRESHDVPVQDVMTAQVHCCRPDATIDKARRLMVEHGVRHLPITSDGQPLGMISSRDVIACQLMAVRVMKNVAERVAALAKGLRDMPLHELVERIIRDVPKIFRARCGALCLPHNPYGKGNGPAVYQDGCLCPDEVPLLRSSLHTLERSEPMRLGSVPAACREKGATGPQVLIPLIGWRETAGEASDPPYLCLCSLSEKGPVAKNLIRYASGLVGDVLGANLASALVYQQAATDSLTGTATRHILTERLQAEYERALRYPSQFAVAILDVDHFKKVNDRFGHQAGDRALKMVGGLLLSSVRETDLVARYGGDEFVILMPETSAEDAGTVMERVRGHLANKTPTDDVTLTASCGITEWSGEAADGPAQVLRRADAALYEAKRAGRNRVCTSQASLTPAAAPQAAGYPA